METLAVTHDERVDVDVNDDLKRELALSVFLFFTTSIALIYFQLQTSSGISQYRSYPRIQAQLGILPSFRLLRRNGEKRFPHGTYPATITR